MPSASRLLRLAQGIAPADASAPADTELLHRYAAERDENAFAELVRRNGPLVLRTCRNVLGEAGADDAFQAVFLLLARSARRLTRPGSLAGWLHAAAVRIANNARRGEGRRRKRESVRPMPTASPDDLSWREVRELLDAEIAALPESHRLPVVLCYVQELSYEEAARRAGCPVGALRGRLERGKERLRKRLARYGLPLAAPALVVGCPPPVSAALVERTIEVIRSAASGAAPSTLGGLLPTTGRLRLALLLTPAAAAIIGVGLVLAASGGPVADQAQVEPPKKTNPVAADPAKRTDRFGDPLPDGVLMRLGTTRSRANIAGFGVLADGSVVTVSPFVEVSTWPPKGDRPGESSRLPVKEARFFNPRPAVSRDGRYVAANTPDKLLVVWERKDGAFKEAVKFDIGSSRLLFSPDGTRLAAGSRICDLRTGKYHELDEPPGNLEAVAFSGDGKRFAGTNGYDAALWDAASGKKLAGYKTGAVRYSGIALDHTGAVMAVSPTWEPETVAFVDPMTGAPIPKLTAPEKFRCLWASFAPDGKTVLLGDRTGVTWWDPVAGKLIRRFEGMAHSWNGGWNLPARFSPDGKTLVGTSTRMLLRWDAATGKSLLPEVHDAGHHAHITAIGVSPDGKWIATGGWDTRLRVWDAGTGRPVAAVPAAWMLGTHNLDFSPDGRFVYGPSSGDVGLSKWETATGREVHRFAFSKDASRRGGVRAFRLSPDGRTLVGISDPFEAAGQILLARWDTESGKTLSEKPTDIEIRFGGCQFSPDGRWTSTSSALYPIETGPAGNTLPREGYGIFDSGEFSADGRLLVKQLLPPPKTENRWRVGVFEVVTGLKVAEFRLESSNTRLAFHPDGRSVVVVGSKVLTFHDLAKGKPFAERKAPAPETEGPEYAFTRAVRFFLDGTKLVTGESDTTALVWEVPARPKAAKALTDKDRAAAWEDLASGDGAKGWAAVWALADDPGAVAFLAERVKPVEPLPAKEFDQLLADLGSEVFVTREAASKQLAKAGERPVGQLRAALRGEQNAERKSRVERLLAVWSGADKKPPAGERLRMVRAVAALELAGTPEARKLLTELAEGAPDATTTREAKRSLERLRR